MLIYFDRETQERLFDKFHSALSPDGFLVLGKVETLLGPLASGSWRWMDASACFGRCDHDRLPRSA